MAILAFSQFLQRLVRTDPPLQQGIATFRLVEQAVNDDRIDEATDLIKYLITEQQIGHEIFARWTERMVRFILKNDEKHVLRDVYEATMLPWLSTTVAPYFHEITGLSPKLTVDGETVHFTWEEAQLTVELARSNDIYPIKITIRGQQCAPIHCLTDALMETFAQGKKDIAHEGIEDLMSWNCCVHEIYCDWCWALLTYIRDTFGENQFGPNMRSTMEDWITERYKDMAKMSPEELLQLSVEGLRGEFFGKDLRGDIEVSEEPDRYVLAFDPCGTGGRMRRGVPQLGTPPRTEAPYNFGVSTGAYDWSWSQKGVCLYCAHCADINELLPIDRIGHPMRVTEYPKEPGDKCRWFIYKNPDLIPDEYYAQVQRSRPKHQAPSRVTRTGSAHDNPSRSSNL